MTITEGADGSTTITLNGNATAISEALDGLTYIPNPGANAITMDGAEVLHFVADDLGGHGTGGSKTTEASLDITVEALNDAPVLTAPLLPPPKRHSTHFLYCKLHAHKLF